MIYSKINDWRDLQNKVCDLLNQVGFVAEKEKNISTPRGKIEVDVFAYDPNSIDQINYIIECKNWNNKIPQSVVHSFTTVMNETGGNIGYIISKNGFQKGSFDYINSTNIKIFTFDELQNKYLNLWLERYFCERIRSYSDNLIQYVEEINSKRFRSINKLDNASKKKFNNLLDKHQLLGFYLTVFSVHSASVPNLFKAKNTIKLPDFDTIKDNFNNYFCLPLKSNNYSDLLIELEPIIDKITNDFNNVFGKNIFK